MKSVIVNGPKIYDPRDRTYKVSDNPALVMADLMARGYIISGIDTRVCDDSVFWAGLSKLADYCDQPASESLNEKVSRTFLDEDGLFAIVIGFDPELEKLVPTIRWNAGMCLSPAQEALIAEKLYELGNLVCESFKKKSFCDGCKHLSPTEEEQDREFKARSRMIWRNPHVCLRTSSKLLHGEHHPKIPRPQNCPGYETDVVACK